MSDGCDAMLSSPGVSSLQPLLTIGSADGTSTGSTDTPVIPLKALCCGCDQRRSLQGSFPGRPPGVYLKMM